MTETAIHRRVTACRAGTEPTVIARLGSGWAVLGDPQVLPGYCLLLPDPVVPHLNALPAVAQQLFLADMARLGQAVQELTDAVRINYAIFGNVEPALHAHVFPRYADEPAERVQANPWGYDWSKAPRFDPASDLELVAALRARLGGAR
jgi:diadenosine tetraphosphate (Ap4A) HIT family hydrolase